MKKRTEVIQIAAFERYVILIQDDKVTSEEANRVAIELAEWWWGDGKFYVLAANTDAKITLEKIESK